MPLSINLPISSGLNFLGNTCSCNRGPIAYCIYFITWYFAVVLYSFKVLNCNTSNNICIYQYLFTITLIDIWNVIFSPTTFSAAGYTELTHLNSGSYNRIMVTSNCILHAILVYKAILWFVDEDVYIFASFIVRRAGLLLSQQDFEWRWSVPLFQCLTVLEFSFILFDLCLLITFFNFIMNYVPIVTFWIFTYHKIWILSIMFCFIWSYWIIYFLVCL